MADPVTNRQFDLKPDISLSDVISFLTEIGGGGSGTADGSHVSKRYLKFGSYPSDSPGDFFVVTYEPTQYTTPGNINPFELQHLLNETQQYLIRYAKATPEVAGALPAKDTELYQVFYYEGKYSSTSYSPTSRTQQKDVIVALLEVAQGLTGQTKEEEAGAPTFLSDISELSYEFRNNNGGNLEENWTNERGVKKFAEYLLSLPIGTPTVEGKDFGRDKEIYTFVHALGALSEYHRRFKEKISVHPNYHQPKASDVEVLKKVEEANYPYFNRGILAATLVSEFELGGKINLDDQRLREFIDLFDQVIEILKKPIPSAAVSGAGEEEGGGEAEQTPEEKAKAAAETITFESFYQWVRDTLVELIYELHYAPLVATIDETNQPVKKFQLKPQLRALIQDRIDATVNLRFELLQACGTGELVNKFKDEKIVNDDETRAWAENYVQNLIPRFDDKNQATQDFQQAIEELQGTVTEVEPSTQPQPEQPSTASVPRLLFNYYLEKEILPPETDFESWEKSTLTQRVDYWKQLSLQDRKKFILEHNLNIYLQIYAQNISSDFIANYIARNHLTGVKPENFPNILSQIQQNALDNLIEKVVDIVPTEYEVDPQLFFLKQSALFSTIRESIVISFGQIVENEVGDYAQHHPPANLPVVQLDTRGKTLEQIALEVNPDLEKINESFISATDRALEMVFLLKYPPEVRLSGLDRTRALQSISISLQEFLLADPEAIAYLFSASPTQKDLFFSKYLHKFIEQRGRQFLPIVENLGNYKHGQVILQSLQGMAGGGNLFRHQLSETLNYIMAEAIISQVDPAQYINRLSDADLISLFNLPSGFTEFAKFKAQLLLYIEKNQIILKLDQALFDPEAEFSQTQFTNDLLNLRDQINKIDSTSGGRLVFQVVTEPTSEVYQVADQTQAVVDQARQEYEKQRILTEAIWHAYTAEQQALIEAEAKRQKLFSAQNLPVYDWAKTVAQGKPESEKKATQNQLKKQTEKAISTAALAGVGALANAALPGVGTVATTIARYLPIPEKYKKYAAVGMVVGAIAQVGYAYLGSWGGFIMGSLGGFFFGPAGFLVGTEVGWMAQNALGLGSGKFAGPLQSLSSLGDLGAKLSDTVGGAGKALGSVGKGIGNIASGIGNGIRGAWNTLFGGGGATPAAASTFASVPSGTFAATGTTLLGGTMIATAIQHSAFLELPPEILNYTQDTASKYVQIQKSATPTQMENGEVATITYTVTITPQAGYTITVNQVKDEISSLGTAKGNPDYVVDQAQITSQLPANTQISNPLTITYSMPNVSGTDVSINNTFELSFFVQDGGEIKTDSARASANVTIGDPELGCFIFGEAGVSMKDGSAAGGTSTSIPWSESEKAIIISAYGEVINKTKFMSLVCSDGPITFYRGAGPYGGRALSHNSLALYDLAVTGHNGAAYSVIHELGHIIDYRNPGLRNEFQLPQNWQGSCFTYPYDCVTGEPFAEAIALYIIHPFYVFGRGIGKYDFPRINPAEYAWVQDKIYGEAGSSPEGE